MFRSAVKRAATVVAAALCSTSESLRNKASSVLPPPAAATRALRFYGASGLHDPQSQRQQQIAQQMIQYAFGLARSRRSAESYAEAMLVLEQGLSNLQVGGGEGSDEAAGMLLVAMSNLLHDRGEHNEAMEKLRMVHQLDHCPLRARVAAWEGLVGLNLEAGQDDAASVLADECLQLLRTSREENTQMSNILLFRGKAIRGLVDLVNGDIESAELHFGECEDCESMEGKYRCGNLALSCGEFLHATGNVSLAKDFYERALQISEAKDGYGHSSLTAANMVPDEVSLGATCALGQLLMHSGEFQGAEEFLTKALNKAEVTFGSSHPKVGVVLTCIAMMFGHKAKIEHSSSLLIQEGLYRRAIDYLKVPTLVEGADVKLEMQRRDIVALARGGYAEILCVQQNRKEEGERLRKSAESAWRNRRVLLTQALEMSEPAKAAIVDTRISRVL